MKHLLRTLLLLVLSAFFRLAFAQQNMTLLSKFTYTQNLASVWGYAANGKEYALVGVFSGLSIVDVTNPTAPVQVQFVPTWNSSWHEIKTWNHYAYVTNESGGGLLIVDLSGLPNSAPYVNWTGGSLNLQTGHSLFIDEFGICYINGPNIANGGTVFLDLNPDPMNPTYLGAYTENYVHDCYVRNNIMYTAEIYKGWFRVVDVSNKSNPVVLAQKSTPGNFTHNTDLSDNGMYLYTTDEKTNSYVTSFDISNLSNITELDRFQANPGTNSIGHNVHVKGNYLVIAYYRDGVIIADAHNPNNLIKVGSYDTSPLSGSGFNGCWEAYPYLPSGNILASDIEQGLYVLGVTYTPAAYLSGTVTDFSTSAALNSVSVSISGAAGSETTTNLSGTYNTGHGTAGTYSVVFSKTGYHTKTISNVSLTNGV
ncbi:MAG: choice-of-anchor B family protein, partial [Chitinophagales bacterium]|nr:choice-of-anchor B family protein [Chitinophagales bacterium]